MTDSLFDRLDYSTNPARVVCSRCGEVARGFATIGEDRYCHPNRTDKPDCYTEAMHDGFANRIDRRPSTTPPGAPL